MKKNVYLLSLFILILLIVACQSQSEKVQFVGESDQWIVQVNLLQGKDDEQRTVKVSYTGENMNLVREVEYEIQSPTWRVYEKGNLIEGTFESPGVSIVSGNTDKNAELIMTIMWNDKTEEIVLISK